MGDLAFEFGTGTAEINAEVPGFQIEDRFQGFAEVCRKRLGRHPKRARHGQLGGRGSV
jgi:hypothetical protein